MENESVEVVDAYAPVSIEMSLSRTVNYATQQNDIPVIHALRIKNNDDSPLEDLCVSITTEPAFSAPWRARIASIAPGESCNLGIIDLSLAHDFLFQLTERILGTVHIEITSDQGLQVRKDEKIVVLAYDEWSGLSGIPEMLAAFVMPNHPAIEKILTEASSILGQWSGDGSLSGYQSKDRQRVALTVAAIYAALQRSTIHYINPPASFEESGQKVRTPDRILENKLGTCLDLAVLASACIEQVGLNALISFVTGHAFAGVWLDDESFPDCATDDVLRLRKRVELGEVCVFETTLLASDQAVPFEQAISEGKRHLDDTNSFRCVIDIARSRKSRIRPLPIRLGNQIIGSVSAPVAPSTALPTATSFVPDFVPVATVPDLPADETPATCESACNNDPHKCLIGV